MLNSYTPSRNRTKYHMLSLYNYNHYATFTFVEILLLPKMKCMTKTFFLNPQPSKRFSLS